MATQPLPNLGVEGTVTPNNTGDKPQTGAPTTPGVATGVLKNTTIEQMNNSLAHMCDFAQDIKKSVGLKKYIKAIAQAIRKGIRAIKRLLGLGDSGGVISTIIQKLKAIATEIRNFIKEYVTPIQAFIKDVVGFVQWAIATIQWILSLPARFIALLADCLKKVMAAIASVFQDALAEAAAADQAEANSELLAAGGTPPLPQPGMSELIAQAKDTLKAGGEAIAAVTKTVGQVAAAATLATTALSTAASSVPGASTLSPTQNVLTTEPTSLADLSNASQSISVIQASLPTANQSASSASSATTPADPKKTV